MSLSLLPQLEHHPIPKGNIYNSSSSTDPPSALLQTKHITQPILVLLASAQQIWEMSKHRVILQCLVHCQEGESKAHVDF